MFLIEAHLYYGESGDDSDTIVIGLFSTTEKAIDAVWNWLREERDSGLEDDVCLCGWRMELDSTNAERLDLTEDSESKHLISRFREIEKEFPPVKEEE